MEDRAAGKNRSGSSDLFDPVAEEAALDASRDGPPHDLPSGGPSRSTQGGPAHWDFADQGMLTNLQPVISNPLVTLKSIDDLLAADHRREKDGFPRKIRIGRMVKPVLGGKDRVVVVPTTVEEKLVHDNLRSTDEASSGGSGEGEEGEVIGEQPVDPTGDSGSGPGEGEGQTHELESNAYDIGRILTEQFQLPNLKDKGRRRSLTRYMYDLTDRHRGFGQLLDKKATLRRIVQTNITLGRLQDPGCIDPSGFLVAPSDRVYRILSREKDWESQAMVFFVRDYSGSMSGPPTEAVVSQHVLIYSWLLYQYDRRVETRFVLHDTTAREVKDFYTYYNSRVAGGTKVVSAYTLVNEIVASENLERDYNLYVFHGTDGDDWDKGGKETLPQLERMLTWVSRMGVTIARRTRSGEEETEVERYLAASGLLERKKDLIRMDVLAADADEKRLIDGIKGMIS
jgi:uncharacterized sporulation protein YeaH/YhbH (DUF444 family)